jgi:hypothetical protein
MATDFGLLTGNVNKHFSPYHLPQECFLYVVHAIAEQEANARCLIDSLDWRLFLMAPEDVERELLNLHQYRKVEYHVAGSLVQLSLPNKSLLDYARTIV